MRDPYGVKGGVIPIDSQDAQVEKALLDLSDATKFPSVVFCFTIRPLTAIIPIARDTPRLLVPCYRAIV